MKIPLVEIVVGRIRMKAPLIGDEATTKQIAEQVNARLQEIEGQSDRLDSLEFALLAAMSFAAELEMGKRAVAEERAQLAESSAEATKELFGQLETIAQALECEPRRKGPRLRT